MSFELSGMLRLTRRQVLQTALPLLGLACVSSPTSAAPDLLEPFLRLSRELTGFDELDREQGQRYLDALLDWEPVLARHLASGPRLPPPLARLIIEAWYTGTVPGPRGTEFVTFEGALGVRCLPRPTPVSFCRA